MLLQGLSCLALNASEAGPEYSSEALDKEGEAFRGFGDSPKVASLTKKEVGPEFKPRPFRGQTVLGFFRSKVPSLQVLPPRGRVP